ncbi:hypothetical protein B0H67DRAFT_383242 [Lasiosphaeris hirsuta]|uniref:Uncharacterized protein n=1 Tax=Lasiosphaeris hirsuta TaxID=260670 RepID=A0AA39ZXF4_9PEZI|nr:hypothetical protein B0H67DRAFT_383242 [Lasiosphaeris hirsuta]
MHSVLSYPETSCRHRTLQSAPPRSLQEREVVQDMATGDNSSRDNRDRRDHGSRQPGQQMVLIRRATPRVARVHDERGSEVTRGEHSAYLQRLVVRTGAAWLAHDDVSRTLHADPQRGLQTGPRRPLSPGRIPRAVLPCNQPDNNRDFGPMEARTRRWQAFRFATPLSKRSRRANRPSHQSAGLGSQTIGRGLHRRPPSTYKHYIVPAISSLHRHQLLCGTSYHMKGSRRLLHTPLSILVPARRI